MFLITKIAAKREPRKVDWSRTKFRPKDRPSKSTALAVRAKKKPKIVTDTAYHRFMRQHGAKLRRAGVTAIAAPTLFSAYYLSKRRKETEKTASMATFQKLLRKVSTGTASSVEKRQMERLHNILRRTGAFSRQKPITKMARDMPSFTKQDRPAKVKEIYRALKRDHPGMPAEMKARIAARQGKPGKQKQGPPYKAPIKEASVNYIRTRLREI